MSQCSILFYPSNTPVLLEFFSWETDRGILMLWLCGPRWKWRDRRDEFNHTHTVLFGSNHWHSSSTGIMHEKLKAPGVIVQEKYMYSDVSAIAWRLWIMHWVGNMYISTWCVCVWTDTWDIKTHGIEPHLPSRYPCLRLQIERDVDIKCGVPA